MTIHSTEPRHFRHRGKAGDILAIDPKAMSVLYTPRDAEKCATITKGIAVLEVSGPLEHKRSWWCDTYEGILARFRACCEDGEVRAILLKLDSPGGDASGLNETIDAMRALKAKHEKPVFAYADESAYSAAYALACVADEIYLPPAGGVGSVGVVSCLVDWTEANKKDGIRYEVITSGARKADGNPNVPISDAARKHVQRRVDSLAVLFFSLVAESRGMSTRRVQSLQADTFYGEDAVAKGLADGVMSLDETIASIHSALDSGTIGASPSTSKPDRPVGNSSGAKTMATLLLLTKAVADARESLAKAPKDGKAVASARLELAMSALAKKCEKEEADEEDDEEASESGESTTTESSMSESEETSESEPSEPSSSAASSTGADDDESAKTGLYTKDRLARMVKQLSGAATIKEAMGWLDAKALALKDANKTAARVARLEKSHTADKIAKMIADGKAAHKITPGNEKRVREGAAEHGVKWLKAFLGATDPVISTREHSPDTDLALPKGVKATADQVKIWKKMGFNAEKIAELSAQYDQEIADMNSRTQNGALKGSN